MKEVLPILIIAVFIVVIMYVKTMPRLSAEAVRERLKQGALVIDVRTATEYQAGHLANAVNIPLDEVKVDLPRRVQDKSTVLLLHCRSGYRSGIAEKELRSLGYINTFNIGSFENAQKIISSE